MQDNSIYSVMSQELNQFSAESLPFGFHIEEPTKELPRRYEPNPKMRVGSDSFHTGGSGFRFSFAQNTISGPTFPHKTIKKCDIC